MPSHPSTQSMHPSCIHLTHFSHPSSHLPHSFHIFIHLSIHSTYLVILSIHTCIYPSVPTYLSIPLSICFIHLSIPLIYLSISSTQLFASIHIYTHQLFSEHSRSLNTEAPHPFPRGDTFPQSASVQMLSESFSIAVALSPARFLMFSASPSS